MDYAVNAALMLAHVAGRMGDTVGRWSLPTVRSL